MTEIDRDYKPVKAEQLEAFKGGVVFLDLKCKAPTLKTRENPELIGATPDQGDRLHMQKDILNQKAFKKVRGVRDKLRGTMERLSLNGSKVAHGLWMIPIGLAQTAEREIELAKSETQDELSKVEPYFPALKTEAQEKLGPLYRESEIPTWEQLAGSFSIEHRWLVMDTPEALKAVKGELYDQEVARLKEQWAGAFDDVRDGLRESFARIVEQLVQVAQIDPETGRPGRGLQDRVVGKFDDFFKLFAVQNVTGDEELQSIVEQARELIGTTTAREMRDDDSLRQRIVDGMEKLSQALPNVSVQAGTKQGRKLKLASSEPEVETAQV